MQLLRSALKGPQRERLTTWLSSNETFNRTHDLAQLIPEFATHGPSIRTADESPEQARFKLFDSVAMVFAHLATEKPLVLIVEDLHDADQPSIHMLRFIVNQLRDASVLLIGTYRDTEVHPSSALSQLIGTLARESTHLPLSGLNKQDTARIIGAYGGRPPNPRFASDIHRATAGNPLFIDALVRVMAAEGRLANATKLDFAIFKVPEGVRETIRRWLAHLADRAPLMAAAAIGHRFEFRCLQLVTQIPNHELLDVLGRSTAMGIVVQGGHGEYEFSHALIRNALLDEFKPKELAQLHLTIGEVTEELCKLDIDAHLNELAYHFVAGGDVAKAIDYSVRAGAAAHAMFAHEDAAEHWQTALELLPEIPANRERRAKLTERAAEALGLAAIDGDRQIKYLESALSLYREIDDSQAAARVQARMANSILGEDLQVELELSSSQNLMEKRATSGDRLLWGRAACAHAFNLSARGLLARSFALVRAVYDEAEQLNDNLTAFGITSVYAEMLMWLSDPVEISNHMRPELGKARVSEAPIIRQILTEWLFIFELPRGNLSKAQWELAQAYGEPLIEAVTAFYRGAWEQADLAAVRAFEQARTGGLGRRLKPYSTWRAKVWHVNGRYDLAEKSLLENIAVGLSEPHLPYELYNRQQLALLYVQTHRTEKAIPHLTRCREVLAGGEDWRGLAGHVERVGAAVAAANGQVELANQQFATAVKVHRNYQVPFEEADTLRCWGRALLKAGERAAAREKFDNAIELYQRHGAGEPWLQRVRIERSLAKSGSPSSDMISDTGRMRLPIKPPPGTSTAAAAKLSSAGIFRKEGDYWTLSMSGTEFRIRDVKGLHYIAYLLRNPEQELAVQDLVSVVSGQELPKTIDQGEGGLIAFGLGDAGVALDARAKAEYRGRLADLQDQLEAAERNNDIGRAATTRAEIEFIRDQIAASVGFRGRDRRVASHAERARVAVTKAIKSALERIRQNDREMGDHLSASIHTGYSCSYVPRSPTVWSV